MAREKNEPCKSECRLAEILLEVEAVFAEKVRQVAEDLGLSEDEFLRAVLAKALYEEGVYSITDVMRVAGPFAATAVLLDADLAGHN